MSSTSPSEDMLVDTTSMKRTNDQSKSTDLGKRGSRTSFRNDSSTSVNSNTNNPTPNSYNQSPTSQSTSSLLQALQNIQAEADIDYSQDRTEQHTDLHNTPNHSMRQSILRFSPDQRPSTKRCTRFQLVVRMDKVQDGEYTSYVRERFLAIMRDIKLCDPTVALLPWRVSDRDAFDDIHDFSSSTSVPIPLPFTLSDLTKYLSSFRIPRDRQKPESWPKICISHTRPAQDLLDNAQEKLMKDKWGMQICRLQVEEVKVIGWLLYSCRHFQYDQTLMAIYSSLFKKDIALYWRKISGSIPNSVNQAYQYAIHVEVEACYARAASIFFSKLYGPKSSRSSWPLGIKMNLIPEPNNFSSEKTERTKFLQSRQGLFTKEIQIATLHSLTGSHDTNISKDASETNIRSAILKITLPGTEETLIFHSLTRGNNNESIVTFFKFSQSYARMVVSSPLTYLRHFYSPDLVDKCFTEEELEKAKSEVMDRKTLEIETAETSMMNYAYNEDGYAGIYQSDVMEFAKSSLSNSPKVISEVPFHLQSYNRPNNPDDSRSVDFTIPFSDTDSYVSRMSNYRQSRDIQQSNQVIQQFNRSSPQTPSQVPQQSAISPNTSVRFSEGHRAGGHGP